MSGFGADGAAMLAPSPQPDAGLRDGSPAMAVWEAGLFGGAQRVQNLVFPVTLAMVRAATRIVGGRPRSRLDELLPWAQGDRLSRPAPCFIRQPDATWARRPA